MQIEDSVEMDEVDAVAMRHLGSTLSLGMVHALECRVEATMTLYVNDSAGRARRAPCMGSGPDEGGCK
jgi:hypothetical protein